MTKERTTSLAYILPVAAFFLFSAVMHDAFIPPESVSPAKIPVVSIPEPELSAQAYLVRFLEEPRPILKRREWKAEAPASITKLMTAFVASEYLLKSDSVAFSSETEKIEEKRSAAIAGESFFRDDMMKFLLIASANDAAYALAAEAGKRIVPAPPLTTVESDSTAGHARAGFTDMLAAFIMEMNRRAEEIGTRATHFQNPAGLDADGHRMSAEDISILFEHMYRERPELLDISRSRESTIASREGKIYALRNTNELLEEFPGIMGSKTGFTDRAKGALAMIYAVAPQKTALIVILHSEDRFGDGKKILHWLEEHFGQ